jgi:hypothetical protein
MCRFVIDYTYTTTESAMHIHSVYGLGVVCDNSNYREE